MSRQGTGRKTTAEVMKKDRRKSPAVTAATQHAALCYRGASAGQFEILLITSRDTGRWVLPKGWPEKGEAGGGTALREAFEEAGVVGQLVDGCVGVYGYDKTMTSGPAQPCVVAVHGVAVAHLAYKFPEMAERQRQWFTPEAAALVVAEPELKTLLLGFCAPGSSARPDRKG